MSSIPTDVKHAIHAGDVDRLSALLAADRSRANALIRWGRNDCVETHPLGAEAVGLRLLDKGAAVGIRGIFDGTPRHWAANMAAGAHVKREWLESKEIQARPEVIAALTPG